jgi:hypothetical protein
MLVGLVNVDAKNENSDFGATSELFAGVNFDNLAVHAIRPLPPPLSPYAQTVPGIINASATHTIFCNFIVSLSCC